MIDDARYTTLEQPAPTVTGRRRMSIGLPAYDPRGDEQRFPLTPEGVRMLIGRGYRVVMESGAADAIHYSDNAYARAGAAIAGRDDALAADIVISLATPAPADIMRMRRGAMLLTLLNCHTITPAAIDAMLGRGIIGVAVDLVGDDRGNTPFGDILSEIDGRAAIAMASSLLADPVNGKGILLGGVAGIVPCEVTVIGSGIAAIAAARSASGLGAMVRMFDNDAYSLRAAARDLGPQIIGSALHDKVLESALRTADVILLTKGTPADYSIGHDRVDMLKKGVLTFDLTDTPGRFFPSMPLVNLNQSRYTSKTYNPDRRVCYINTGNAVPRTAAMALSNTFLTMFENIVVADGVTNALKLTGGLRRGVFTFLGKVTNPDVARLMRCRAVDISIFLHLS